MAERTTDSLLSANRAFYDAFEQLDVDLMANLWSDTALVSCVHPGWDLLVGSERVLESWRQIFAGTESIRFEILEPQATVREDAGWVVCLERLHTTMQGQPVENTMATINTFVWERNAWRVTHHHAAPRLRGRPTLKGEQKAILH